ncbi:hypothetical protein [Actinoplanes aureus]|uniref:Uncharacterized protein n=1 Tax=Actinoplanes aureus TaxID=2792083 RepID=A0A931C783_9ACTN|nr:hypothetical protein [Actinoplanes aureus]MBG0561758.1 hypothetical protein [Actinoplanes aureus]
MDELAHRAIEAFESMNGGDALDYQVLLLTVASSVFGQVEQALCQLMYVALRKEQEIADAMTAMSATVAARRERFVSPRPALADQTRRTILTPQGLDYDA